MTDERAARIAEFIAPLRVHPGRRVRLAHDFDPGYRSDTVRKKKDGVELLRTGVALLADYQSLLAAQDTYGVLVCLVCEARMTPGSDSFRGAKQVPRNLKARPSPGGGARQPGQAPARPANACPQEPQRLTGHP